MTGANPRRDARFEAHLGLCPPCALYLQQIRDSRETLGRVELDTISEDARDQRLRVGLEPATDPVLDPPGRVVCRTSDG